MDTDGCTRSASPDRKPFDHFATVDQEVKWMISMTLLATPLASITRDALDCLPSMSEQMAIQGCNSHQ